MNTWIYYEFIHTVHFPVDRACTRAELGKQFRHSGHDAEGVTFGCENDQAVFVPWANVRYAGGCITPKFAPEPEPAPPLAELAKDATSIRLVKKPKK